MRTYDVTFSTIAWKSMRAIVTAENLDELTAILTERFGDITITTCKMEEAKE